MLISNRTSQRADYINSPLSIQGCPFRLMDGVIDASQQQSLGKRRGTLYAFWTSCTDVKTCTCMTQVIHVHAVANF